MKKPIKDQKAVLIILLSNIFIPFLGIGLIIPVMPSFMNIMHLSGSTMGYLIAVFAVAQLIMSPFAGRWVDRYGRKKIITLGLFLFGISELIFGVGTHVSVLYLSRILGGLVPPLLCQVLLHMLQILHQFRNGQKQWAIFLPLLALVLL